ncbi:hypothetical protein [Planomonospora parontospora]|uniref:hypothetical protein n=1 Tax=Planomonospora parontospora TaxID=58119 RepID=UPI001945137F|nr:hypothetical protein [Planomonospora parontospora]GGL58451.1 hypothetical protein GCM10014719_69790 [Planomonospora parontospora subsp. antibiotica]GII20209.1 hypothetical protein Ppa05_69350 [Planomonospora parontospora subsp. antibiotica]
MSEPARTVNGPPPGRWRRWSSWAGYAALGWALLYGGFGLITALTGTPMFYRADEPLPVALNWISVAVAASAAVTVSAAVRSWGRRVPRPVVPVTLIGLCVLIGAAAFGLLMDVVTLVFTQRVDSWTATANRALAAIGVLLLIATTRAHRSSGACVRCGAVHTSSTARSRPEPTPAPPRVRVLAYAGAAAFLPYAAMKTIWALGGTFAGVSGAQMLATMERNGASGALLALERRGIDATALLAALGVFLIFGLVRPWGQTFPRWTPVLRGRRVPRWLPLAPALIGAATLAPYGAIGLVYAALGTSGAVTVSRGDFPTPGDALLVTWIGLGAFAVYGIALAVAAWSYLRRTRPVCALLVSRPATG